MPRDEIERAIEALLRCHRREFIAICLRRLVMRREDSDYAFHMCILWFPSAGGYGLVGLYRECSEIVWIQPSKRSLGRLHQWDPLMAESGNATR